MSDLSIASKIAFSFSVFEAQALGSEYVDSEHLFIGLCKVEDILNVGKESVRGISDKEWQDAKKETKEFRDFLLSNGLDPVKTRRRLRKILSEVQKGKKEFSGHRSKRCKEAFAKAETMSRTDGKAFILLRHLFLAVLSQHSPQIERLFLEFSLKINDFQKDYPKEQDEGGKRATDDEKPEEVELQSNKESKTPFLDKFGRDITKLAIEGKLDPVIGRKDEIKKVVQILIQKRKNNPILVGDAGTGKTCIVEGLAQRIVAPNSPENIRNLRIVEISMGGIVAGTKYRGEFEEKLEKIVKEASSDPNIVLFIDEIHTAVGAGSVEGNTLDASNILKPALARGEIKCIGATTTGEYRKYIEKDPAFARRFQIVWVDEPTREEAVEILKGIRPKFEEYHKVKISDEAIEKTVELSMKYLTDLRLPDKAIDIIDQACARKILKTISHFEKSRKREVITAGDVLKVVSEMTRIPMDSLTEDEKERLLRMEDYLRKRVMGQEHAIKEVSDTTRMAKLELKAPNKPLAVFLFVGATGTGKTELAKAIADFLFHNENRLLVFDMSEYQEKHAIARLIGAPPGYVGHEEEGELTSKVRTYPYSVVLFDEIEKAHPDIFDIFLHIFDEGRLTDSHGRRVSFSETVIILTSNAGSDLARVEDGGKKVVGFDIEKQIDTNEKEDKWKEYEKQILQALSIAFRPDFLNRIQKKIIFYPLDKDTVKEILEKKLLKAFNEQISVKGIKVSLSDSAKDFLIEKGYSEIYGMREMQRIFDQYITETISKMILKNEVKQGQILEVSVSNGTMHFRILK